LIYLDTSILATYYLPEKISSQVQTYIQGKSQLITELTRLEFYSALSIKVRTNSLLKSDAKRVMELFKSHLGAAYYLNKRLNPKHYDKTGEYIATLSLPIKTPDALHLAFAASENLKIVTADKQLANNASELDIDYELF